MKSLILLAFLISQTQEVVSPLTALSQCMVRVKKLANTQREPSAAENFQEDAVVMEYKRKIRVSSHLSSARHRNLDPKIVNAETASRIKAFTVISRFIEGSKEANPAVKILGETLVKVQSSGKIDDEVIRQTVIDDLLDELIDRVFSWTTEFSSAETKYEHPLRVYDRLRGGKGDDESLRAQLEILLEFRQHRIQ